MSFVFKKYNQSNWIVINLIEIGKLSYNKFNHNVYRDATIVTTLDTFTSLLAGCTIFGILGHLAHEIGTDDIASVVKGGTGLAFISYPDAIASPHHRWPK